MLNKKLAFEELETKNNASDAKWELNKVWHVAVGSMQGGTCRQQAARCASNAGEKIEVAQILRREFESTYREAA